MGNLDAENVRYQRTEDVSRDTAEQAKRQQSEQEAAIRDRNTNEGDVPDADNDKALPGA